MIATMSTFQLLHWEIWYQKEKQFSNNWEERLVLYFIVKLGNSLIIIRSDGYEFF